MSKKKDSRLAKAGVSGYNKPKRTPNPLLNHMWLLLKKVTRLKLLDLDNKVKK